jgi:SAM-dependent methyltransferase
MLDAERNYYLRTKPFYNLANKPVKHTGDGMDPETHRHFTDFANMAVALALPAGARILDVGCGSGWLSEYFARLGYEMTGIDISDDLIQMARERVERIPYNVDHETPLKCRFITHDVETGALAEKFDAVICYDSLHHFVDEHAVMQHLSAMVARGGLLFILEGDKPEEGSATEEELVGVMREFATLESPFDPEYLRELIVEHGFKVIGDYVSANGLFERETVEDGRVAIDPAQINYLLCKKVVDGVSTAADFPDSRAPGKLTARINVVDSFPASVVPNSEISVRLRIENTGDTIWLTGPARRKGAVMLGVMLLDEAGSTISERHGEPPLPRALAPGESVETVIGFRAPAVPGKYRLKVDLVAQHVAWFEQQGSEPLLLPFEVSPALHK